MIRMLLKSTPQAYHQEDQHNPAIMRFEVERGIWVPREHPRSKWRLVMLDLVRGSPPFKTDKELLQSFVMGPAAKVASQSMLMMHDHDAIQCSLKNAEKC